MRKLSILAACAVTALTVNAAGIITNPKGTATVYSRSSIAIAPIGDMPADTEDYGFAGIIVSGDNGKVYLKNPFSQFLTDSYLVGQTDGETITVELPQPIYFIDDEEVGTFELYAQLMQFTEDGDDLELSDNQTLTLVNYYGMWVMDDEESILALTFDEGEWTGFGEMGMCYMPIEETPAEWPADAAKEQWALINGGTGHFVDVAFTEDSCFIGGMLPIEKGGLAPVVGSVSAEVIVIPSGQYLGVNEDNSYLTYLYSGKVEEVYLEEYDWTVTRFIPGEDLVMTGDRETGFVADGDLIFTPFTDFDSEYFWYMDLMKRPRLVKNELTTFRPANPEIKAYQYYDVYGFGYVSIDIPMLNVDGMLLDSKDMYYNLYIDGEMVTFTPDEYHMLEEEITDIPYSFADMEENMGDFKVEDSLHTIMLFREGISSIGVQSFCRDADGQDCFSDLVTTLTTSVDGVTSGDSGAATYIDMTGRRVTNPGKGLYIKMEGGRARKVMK